MFFAGIIALLFLTDMIIKTTIEDTDSSAFPKELEGTQGKIMLHKNHNDGFPFGVLKDRPELVQGVPLAVTSAVAGIFAWLISRKGHNVEKLAFSLILGGALSNLYDRFVRHYVVDYFSIQWKGLKKVVFNLGDIFIFLGTGIMLVWEIIETLRGK